MATKRLAGNVATGMRITAAGLMAIMVQSEATAQDADNLIVLPPIVVEGTPGVVTEDTGSFTTGRSTVGYKQPVDVRHVPLTVNVVTRQRLDDSEANSLEEAGYLLPNLTTATGNGLDGSLYSRGHEVFTYNVDGAPRSFLSLYGTAPDLVFFDRIEVLSGPSGVFQGSGEPVGTVNLVRKRPMRPLGASLSAIVGSYDFRRGEVDLQAALTPGDQLRGRVIAYGVDRESFIDIAEQQRGGGYATIEADITANTTFAAGAIVETQDTVGMSGLPTFSDGGLIDFDRETFIGAPWNVRDIRTREGFLEVENVFEDGSVLKFNGRYYARNTDIKNALPSTAVDRTTGNFSMFVFARKFDERTAYLDANYTSPFLFFGRESEFSVGADIRDTSQTTLQNFDFSLGVQNINTFDPFSLVEPIVTFPGVGPGFRLNWTTETSELGGYGYVRLQVLDGLNITAGARHATYDSVSRDLGRNRPLSRISKHRFVPLVGLSYDLNEMFTAYASYSEIFQPQTEQRADGSQLDPILGRQFEVGGKASFFDGALRAQAAIFLLKDTNRAQTDPANVGAFLPSGKATTRGFEATVTGSPLQGVDIVLGHSYHDTDLMDDPSPAHNFVAFGKYTFQTGPLEGLYFGVGVRSVSSFDNVSDGILIKAPGYTVADLSAGYQIGDYVSAQLSVRNLFDNTYIERVNQVDRGTFYGEPLTAMFRLTIEY